MNREARPRRLVGRLLPDGGSLPDDVWRARHRGILVLLWLHVPGLAVVALLLGNTWRHTLVEVSAIAALAGCASLCGGRRRESTVLTSLGLVSSSAVLVHLSGGMIEAHFHFFLMIGVVVLYQEWWPFLVGIGFVVLHHGVVGVISPHDVYNHPSAWARPWAWAALHGFSVLAMSATGVATWRLNESLRWATVDREAKAREAERARYRSEQLYRGIVETTREGVWMFDADYLTTFVNPQLTFMLGYPPEELLGTRLQAHVGGEVPEATDRAQAQIDCKLRRKDGGELPALLSISWSVSQEDGSVAGLAMVSDITELKRTEEALARARDEAVEASRLKSQFLANTSHEIRTPMTVILGMNELLLETGLDETQLKFVDAVKRAGNGLLSIINDILDFSKIEAGRLQLETADVEVRAILDDVVSFLTGPARGKGLHLASACDPAVPEVILGDSTRLRQILLNLAANAVKFTEAGSVDVRVALAPGGGGDHLRFEVADTGIGIAPEQQDLLFRPFSQVDASTTRRFGGTGLGLAIAAQLVEAMGGRIGVHSRVGTGSTFWFEIPSARVLALPSPRR